NRGLLASLVRHGELSAGGTKSCAVFPQLPRPPSDNTGMQSKSGRKLTIAAFLLALATLPAGTQAQTRRDRQVETAMKLSPALIDLRPGPRPPERGGPPRILRVRVWAARDYRNQTIGWQTHFRRLVERVNQRVSRWPNVRFEVLELKEW